MYDIRSIIVKNRELTSYVDVSGALISANLSLSTTSVGQLTLSFADFVDFSITRRGVFSPSALVEISDSRKKRHRYTVSVMQIDSSRSPTNITFSARSFAAQSFKKNKSPLVKRDISPTDFLRQEAYGVSATINAENTQKRSSISRVNNENQQESTWDVMNKMASELGFLFFEYEGIFHFGRPTWFAGKPTKWWFDYEESGVRPVSTSDIGSAVKVTPYGLPSCRRSEDDKKNIATVDLLVDRTYGSLVRPGDCVYFSGVPYWEGKYIVQNISYDVMNTASPISLNIVTPVNPKEPKTGSGGGKGDLSGLGTGILEGDTNGDGRVTVDEYYDFFDKNGRYPGEGANAGSNT